MAPDQDDNQVSQVKTDQDDKVKADRDDKVKADRDDKVKADRDAVKADTDDKVKAEQDAVKADTDTNLSDQTDLSAKAGDEADKPADQARSGADIGPNTEVPDLPDFSGMLSDAAASSIEMLNDVELNVKIELGRTEMDVESILHLTTGSVVELDKLAGDPVDILVNEQLVAKGEVLVVNDNFCVRINEIVKGVTERFAQMT